MKFFDRFCDIFLIHSACWLIVSGALLIGPTSSSFAVELHDNNAHEVSDELLIMRKQLAEFFDREEIRQLAVSYAHYARIKDVDRLVMLYSRNAIFEVPAGMGTESGIRSGRDEIRKSLIKDLPRSDPWPFIHQHYIEKKGVNLAHGILYFELRQGGENFRTTHVGFYTDDYIKEDGKWRFYSRKLTVIPLPAKSNLGKR